MFLKISLVLLAAAAVAIIYVRRRRSHSSSNGSAFDAAGTSCQGTDATIVVLYGTPSASKGVRTSRFQTGFASSSPEGTCTGFVFDGPAADDPNAGMDGLPFGGYPAAEDAEFLPLNNGVPVDSDLPVAEPSELEPGTDIDSLPHAEPIEPGDPAYRQPRSDVYLSHPVASFDFDQSDVQTDPFLGKPGRSVPMDDWTPAEIARVSSDFRRRRGQN